MTDPLEEKMSAMRRAGGFFFAASRFRGIVPESIALKTARADWERRAKLAFDAFKPPEACFRIRGDSESRCWLVEKFYLNHLRWPDGFWRCETDEAKIASFREHEPVAEGSWNEIEEFPSYAKALEFLREYAKPIPDESVYFTKDGREVLFG